MFAKVMKDSFLKHNMVLFSGGMIASFVNFLFHPILSRMLSVSDFGEAQALISLSANLLIFTSVFAGIVVHMEANKEGEDEVSAQERLKMISVLKKLAIILASVLFVLMMFASQLLQSFFHFDSVWPFVGLAPMVVVGVHLTFRRAHLRGRMNFKAIAMAEIFVAVARLLCSAVLVYIGFRSFGVIAGVLVSQIVGFFYVYSKSRKTVSFDKNIRVEWNETLKKELRFGALILAINIVSVALSTADTLIVKHFFSPIEAGYYSGISTIGRIVLYVTGSVAIVLFSSVKLRNSMEENRRLLVRAMGLVALAGGAVLGVFALLPELLVHILVGKQYVGSADLLPKIGLLMLFVALVNTIFSYHVALRKQSAAYVGGAGLALIALLSVMNHATVDAVVFDLIIGTLFMLFLFSVTWVVEGKKLGVYARK